MLLEETRIKQETTSCSLSSENAFLECLRVKRCQWSENLGQRPP